MFPLKIPTSFLRITFLALLLTKSVPAKTLDFLTRVATRECPLNVLPALQPDARFGCPVPVDESADQRSPASYSPWTHHPECLESLARPGTKYCVFTNSRHGNQGVSIITRPETAANSVEILNERETAHWEPRRQRNNTVADASWALVPVEGKGMGVVARRGIRKAEAIMFDYASIVLDLRFPESVRQVDGYQLLHRATDQLVDPDRVLELGRSSKMAADVVEDVMRTNSFSFTLAGEDHMALYPDVSRINHACNPNFAVSVIAVRDIELGEEITISYIAIGKASEERRRLLSRWGFNCTCSLCNASKAEVASSDYRRNKIKALRDQVMDAIKRWDGTEAVKLTHEVLRMMRIEQMDQLYAEQYEILARLHWAAKDTKNAEKYAQMSLDVLEEQGYIDARPGHLEVLLKSFDD